MRARFSALVAVAKWAHAETSWPVKVLVAAWVAMPLIVMFIEAQR